MASLSKKIVTGSFLRVVLFFLTATLNIFLTPFIIKSLGDKSYGLWVLVGTFLGYYGLLDLGLNFAVKRFVSRGLGAKDFKEVNHVFNTSIVVLSFIGLLTMLASLIIGFTVPILIKNISEPALFRIILIMLGINLGLGFPFSVFSGLLAADLRYDIATSIDLVKLLVRTFLVFVLLNSGYGIVALAIATISVDFLGYIISFFFVKSAFPALFFSLRLVRKKSLKQIFGYSTLTFVAKIADQLRFNIDNLVIVIFLGLNSVTVYSIGFRLLQYFYDFLESALGMTLPIFSRLEGANDFESIRNKYMFWTKISTYLSLSVGSILFILGKVFIIKWVGAEYRLAYDILIILLIPSMMEVFQPIRGILFGLSKHRFFTIATCIEGVFNLILSIILVRKFGLIGVAMGTAIPMFINQVIIQPLYVSKVIELSLKKVYFGVIFPAIILVVSFSAFLSFLLKSFIILNYTAMLMFAIIFLVIQVVLIFSFGFNNEEKDLIRRIILKPIGIGKIK